MKIKTYLYPFVTCHQLCPICRKPLVKLEGHPKKYCPNEGENGPHCPYFFEIFALQRDRDCYDTIEMTLHEAKCRVWIAKWKTLEVIKIGEHQHITCVKLPIQKANLQDMDKFIHKIKTILTFQ